MKSLLDGTSLSTLLIKQFAVIIQAILFIILHPGDAYFMLNFE